MTHFNRFDVKPGAERRTEISRIMIRDPSDDDGALPVSLLEIRLSNIERMLVTLVEQQQLKEWYDMEQFARIVGKAPFTVREWARLKRIRAENGSLVVGPMLPGW